jgi:CDP-diacylglycerol--glycerol-3-phosphate 3-phosphatidyltransferase/cardiolipin synthase
MSRAALRWAPSLLSVVRGALALPLGLAVAARADAAALACLGAAAATDVIDGRLARRLRVASAAGAWLDVGADALVTTVALAMLGNTGALPSALFVAPLLAFGVFAATSRHGRPRYDPVGKYYGAWLFAVAGATLALSDLAVAATLSAATVLLTALVVAGRFRAGPAPPPRSPASTATPRTAPGP